MRFTRSSIYSLPFSFVSISPWVRVMWFQAINKGPSRLPGSTVDIRIPNRLAGNGADMFHIIETQVDANSSLSTLFTQPKSLFITSNTCRKPHFELAYSAHARRSLLLCEARPPACTSENALMHRKLLICGLFSHGMGNLLCVRHRRASENVGQSVDVATEAIHPFRFTTFCI